MIVADTVTGNSRVQRVALAAAYDGWDVMMIGRSSTGRGRETWMGPVEVVRVPVVPLIERQENQRRRNAPGRRMLRAGMTVPADVERAHAVRAAAARHQEEKIAGPAGLRRFARRIGARTRRDLFAARLKANRWGTRITSDPSKPLGDWRRDVPSILDFDRMMGPAIEEFRPDVIHANDVASLYTAATAAARLRGMGHDVRWLYDAAVHVAATSWPTPRTVSGFPQVERQYIHRADAVIAASPEIAAALSDAHGLATMPLVVRNTPPRAAVGRATDKSVRATVGLGETTPLLVIAGDLRVQPAAATALEALAAMPDVHLAIVANQADKTAARLLTIGRDTGVSKRVHVVPCVAHHEMADYLSSADAGILCHEPAAGEAQSIPTTFAEYMHAGLAVLVSDVQLLGAHVRSHGVGEAFEPGDQESFRRGARAVLDARDVYAGRISEDILTELSWEVQSAGLLELYRQLGGIAALPPYDDEATWSVEETPQRVNPPVTAVASGRVEPTWRPLTPSTPIRLGLGPANYAGQLAAIAQAVTRYREDVSAEVTMHTGGKPPGYSADVYADTSTLHRLDVQVAHLRRILPRYTHLIADAFKPVFGTLNGNDIAGDLAALEQANIKVALLAHGSEIRSPEQHRARNPQSHFHDARDTDLLNALSRIANRNRAILASTDLPVFVTTPDLLDDVPQATWLPLVIDMDSWATATPIMERERPVVLHAPSARWAKGTDRFLPALLALENQGLITLNLVEGLPWPEMQRQVKEADIVVDQVAVGAYGAFACEAMAAGKPVIAYLTEKVTEVVGEELPILNATGAEVATTIEHLVADRERARTIGAASAAYARAVHDGTRSARILDDFLR